MRIRHHFTGPRLITILMALTIIFLIWLLVFAYLASSARTKQLAEEARRDAERNEALVGRVESLAMDIKAVQQSDRRLFGLHRDDTEEAHEKLLKRIGRQHARLLEAMGIESETARAVFEVGRRQGEVEIVHVHHHHPGPVRHQHHHHHHHHRQCDNQGTQAAQDAGGPQCK